MENSKKSIESEVVLSFRETLSNLEKFDAALSGVDERFGSISSRISALQFSLAGLRQTPAKDTATSMRDTIEAELERVAGSNGIIVEAMGNMAFSIGKETTEKIMKSVEDEVNKALLDMVKDIQVDLGAFKKPGNISLSSEEFSAINKQIVKLIKDEVAGVVLSIGEQANNFLNEEDMIGLKTIIEGGTVQAIVSKIKGELLRALGNSTIHEDSIKLTFTEADFNPLLTNLKDTLKKAFSVVAVGGDTVDAKNLKLADITKNIDTAMEQYVNNMTKGIQNSVSPQASMPIAQAGKRIRQTIADNLNEKDVAKVEQQLNTIRLSDGEYYDLKSRFGAVSGTIAKKPRSAQKEGAGEAFVQLGDIEPQNEHQLQLYLVKQIERVNKHIVKKIKEQFNQQFEQLVAEVNGTVTSPNKNRESLVPTQSLGERNSRKAGIEGAVSKIIPQIVENSVLGDPIKLISQGFDSLRVAQQEQLKIIQNFAFKNNPNYKIDSSNGNQLVNYGALESDVSNLRKYIDQTALTYATDYDETYKAAGTASRLFEKPEEIRKFLDIIGQINAIDAETDLNTAALGLETIMDQFERGVFQMNAPGTGRADIVRTIAAVSNTTKVSANEIFESLKDSGSVFSLNRVDFDKAAAMSAVATQSTGLADVNMSSFWETVSKRVKTEQSETALKSIGVDIYKAGEDGNKKFIGLDQVFYEMSKVLPAVNDQRRIEVSKSLFGSYQEGKDISSVFDFSQFKEIMDGLNSIRDEDIQALIAKSTTSPNAAMDRAELSIRLAFVNVMEELLPQITTVADGIANLSDLISENSGVVAGLIDILASVLVGFLAVKGVRKGLDKFGYQEAAEVSRTRGNLLGDPGLPFNGAFAKDGVLRKAGYGVAPELLSLSGRNYERFTEALKNPTLAPHLKEIAGYDTKRMEQMLDYHQDTYGRPISSLEELITASKLSQDYVKNGKVPTNDFYSRANYSFTELQSAQNKTSGGIDRNFLNNMEGMFRDPRGFEQMASTGVGANISNRLANMDPTQMNGFVKHLDDLHKTTGRSVTDMASLSKALDDYAVRQGNAGQQVMRSQPEFHSLSVAVADVNQKVSTSSTKGLSAFNKLLRDMPNVARGAGSAIKGLGASMAALAPELIAMAAIGEVIKNVSYGVMTSPEQKKLDKTEKELRSADQFGNKLKYHAKGDHITPYLIDLFIDEPLDIINRLFRSNYVSSGDQHTDQDNMEKMIKEKYGVEVAPVFTNASIASFAKKNNITINDLIAEYKAYGGKDSLIGQKTEAERVIFAQQYEEMKLKEEEERKSQEEEDKKWKEKMKAKWATGDTSQISAKSIQDGLKENIDALKTTHGASLSALLASGVKSYEDRYIQERQSQSQKLIELYDNEVKRIQDIIDGLDAKIAAYEASGNTGDEDYQKLVSERSRMKGIQKEVSETIGKERDDIQVQSDQDYFNSRMNQITRAANISEMQFQAKEYARNLIMDRNSKEYFDASLAASMEKIQVYQNELAKLEAESGLGDLDGSLKLRKMEVSNRIRAEQERLKGLRLSSIGASMLPIGERLEDMDMEYLAARARTGADEDSPFMRNLRVSMNKTRIAEFQEEIAAREQWLKANPGAEEAKEIQQQIRDLTKQSLQAQLGIWDEVKQQSGTFNLPEGIRPMSYYQHITRNASSSAYTVQGGDVSVQVILPNITDKTNEGQLYQIGRSLGRGLGDGTNGGLRLQQLGNPFPRYKS